MIKTAVGIHIVMSMGLNSYTFPGTYATVVGKSESSKVEIENILKVVHADLLSKNKKKEKHCYQWPPPVSSTQ